MNSSSSSNFGTGPPNSPLPLLTSKSWKKYMKAYYNFALWKKRKGVKSFSEPVFLAYFKELAKSKKPSTLWSTYSMLKSTVGNKNGIKMENYTKLISYLKKWSRGHKSTTSEVFSVENINTFIKEAPDKEFLAIKVALIFGIKGACRANELLNITVNDVKKQSDQLLFVKMTDSITKMDRSFTVPDEYKSIVEKYQALRPNNVENNRFFIRYQNGKCYKHVIGKNKFSSMPQEIANYLKLPDSKLYTGHCFRRTAAALLAESGNAPSNKQKKRHGERKSSKTTKELRKKDSTKKKAKKNACPTENVQLDLDTLDDALFSPSSSYLPTLQQQEPSTAPLLEYLSYQPEPIIDSYTQNNNVTTMFIPNKPITIMIENGTNVSNINIIF
ncbi:uncharacterized protein LOC131847527 [Achroia grisella]|uniref:uncharacterized protein LOC131847527 n=1 Tax=Achroia grisella TaxID=688607 RepID=UPI0027D1FE54|nr:uncharacterized protein LOC131847527 [Achroia grisella]